MYQICEGCRFWLRINEEERSISDRYHSINDGYCRRYPPLFPRFVWIVDADSREKKAWIEHMDDAGGTFWPQVHANSWCGEWQEKIKEAD